MEGVREVTGRDIPVRIESLHPGDPSGLIADPTKARTALGWEPIVMVHHSAWEWLRRPRRVPLVGRRIPRRAGTEPRDGSEHA